MNRHQLLTILANDCERWSHEELLQFAFSELYDHYNKYPDHELKQIIRSIYPWDKLSELTSKKNEGV